MCRCFCNPYQGFSITPTSETFCASVTSSDKPTYIVSSRSAINLAEADFATFAPGAELPFTFKVSGSVDIFASGYYTFCIDSENATLPVVSPFVPATSMV
jgi:hypothetical protein